MREENGQGENMNREGNKIRILIADDETEIRDLLRLYLEKEGYEVIEADNGTKAAELFDSGEASELDFAVIDVMMPGMDGFRLVKKIRETSNIPLLILSAKIQDSDKILGLGLGADDYMTKPFNPLEVVARIASHLRRFHSLGGRIPAKNQLEFRDLVLDLDSCLLYRREQMIELTSVEFRILQMFMGNPGKVFTKQQIFQQGWKEDFVVDDNSIMVCISKLRSKLSKEDPGMYIRTIRGLGYRLEKE